MSIEISEQQYRLYCLYKPILNNQFLYYLIQYIVYYYYLDLHYSKFNKHKTLFIITKHNGLLYCIIEFKLQYHTHVYN